MQLKHITSSTPYNNSPVTQQSVEASSSNTVSAVAKKRICDECHKEVPKTFTDRQCKRVTYCGPECQKSAWKSHAIACWNHNLIPTNDVPVCKFINAQGALCDISQAEYQKMTNSTFVTKNLFPKKLLKQMGLEPKEKTEIETPKVSDVIAVQFQGNNMGFGIVALKDIEAGQILCSLGGKISLNKDGYFYDRTERQRLYTLLFEDYVSDASKYSGPGSLVNDGIPNVDFEVKETQDSNHPFDIVVQAIRNIKSGEFLYIDYGACHPVKSQFYQIDYRSLDQLIGRYSGGLDFSEEYISKRSTELNISELQIECELQYICHTPHVIALFHLLSKVDPLQTLKKMNNIPKVLLGEWYYEKSIISIPKLLHGLSKITEKERDDFVKLVKKISGYCLRIICTTLSNLKSVPSMQDFEKYARLVEENHLLFYASFNHTYTDWSELEKWEFIEKFLTYDHQNKVLSVEKSKSLPEDLQTEYLLLQSAYISDIINLITKGGLERLTPMQNYIFSLLKSTSS